MKNKIFFTSMLVMLMACPAFAVENGEIDDGVTSANCFGTPLIFGGEEKTSGALSYAAQWDLDTYDINYTVGEGTLGAGSPTTYTVEDGSFTIPDPTRGGYAFNGWTASIANNGAWGNGSSGSGSTGFTVGAGTYGDISLTANWNNITCTCTVGTGAESCNSSLDTSNNTCDYDWGCQNGYYNATQSVTGQGTSYAPTCNECPAGYDGSDNGRDANTDCYKNCSNISVTHADSVTPVANKVYYNGSAYPTCTYHVECEDGYHAVNNDTANPTCVGNAIGLSWYMDDNKTEAAEGPGTCVYGTANGITNIVQPDKHGYTFTGWKVIDWTNE